MWRSCFLILACALPPLANAATHRVPSEYSTINQALDASAFGDTVLVAPGTYSDVETRTVPWNGGGQTTSTSMAFLKDGVLLTSESGSAATVLDYRAVVDPPGGARVMLGGALVSGTTVVEGFTLLAGDHPISRGIYLDSETGDFTARDCVFDGFDIRPFSSAAISYDGSQSTLNIEGCVMRNCQGFRGGAIGVINTDLVVTDTVFESNVAGVGGAVRFGGDTNDPIVHTARFERCRFEGNQAGGGGGAISGSSSTNNSYLSVDIVDCVFVDNEAENDGAVGIALEPGTHARIEGCAFIGNRATAAGGSGGSLRLTGGELELISCTFWGNSATEDGGSIALVNTGTTLRGNIIAGSSGGEAVFGFQGQTPDAEWNVFWQNLGENATYPLRPTDMEVDPQFCAPELGDFALRATSPCLPQNHPLEYPETIGAFGEACIGDGTVALALKSDPVGRFVSADGLPEAAPQVSSWLPGTMHTVSTDSVQQGAVGTRYVFQSWSDGGASAHSINVPSSYSELTATFGTEYFLTTATDSGGQVDASGWNASGSVVEVHAVPDSGYSFSHWTGSGSGSYSGAANPAVVTMSGPITQTAYFLPNQYPMTMIAGEGGAVSPATAFFDRGSTVEIVAIPDSGYVFASWLGIGSFGYTGTSNPATVQIEGPITQTATFTTAFPTLTMVAEPGGSVTPLSGGQPLGMDVEIEAIPDEGYAFAGWTGVGSGSYTGPDNPATVTMHEPLTQTASFANAPYVLEMLAGEGGTVTPQTGGFPSFSTVQIEAIPAPNYRFRSWKGQGDGSYTGDQRVASITMNGPITQLAEFDRLAFEVTLSLSGTDPHVHTGDPLGFGNVYLWLDCGTEGGLTGLEARVSGTLQPVAFQPAPGILNGGSATDLTLAMGCVTGPALLGQFIVLPPGEGSMCLTTTAPVPELFVTDCQLPSARFSWPPDLKITGVRTDGGVPCESGRGCDDVAPIGGAVGAPLPPASPPVVYETRFDGGFPNPFTSTTTIRFSLATGSHARLSIYDVTGRLVRTLVDAERVAGAYEVPWSGQDGRGGVVPAGIYFAKLEAGGLRETRKLVRLAAR